MVLNPNELTQNKTIAAALRCGSTTTKPGKIGAISGAPLLALLTPMAFNKTLAVWVPWLAIGATEIQTLNLGAASAGTITISFDGSTTASIAFNATAAAVQAALLLLPNLNPGDVVVTGGPLPATVTLTFGGQWLNRDIPAITVTPTGLTGGTVTVVTPTEGVSDETQTIKAFIWPDEAQTSATQEVLAQMTRKAKIHFADIPLFGANTSQQLKDALRDQAMIRGFIIDGLSQVR